ncbi:leukosialin [Tupaia chinensis]|uniref:leukosialin n=1 Tax=Tupaia chinensis TaxID=246437 RepID=UPI0003C8DE09|nr:leukosialin [Tupaia chinensis]
MPAALEMALLLLFGGLWVQEVSPQMATSNESSNSLALATTEALTFSSTMATDSTARDPKVASTGDQTSTLPPSAPLGALELASPGTSTDVSTGPLVLEPTTSQEASTMKPSMSLEVSNTTSDPGVDSLGPHAVMGGATATGSLEPSSGTSDPPVATTISSLEPSGGTSGPPVIMTTSGTPGPPVTTAISSLETSSGTSGLPVIMTTSSLEISSGTTGLPVTMATSSLETSSGTSGPPVITAVIFLETSRGTSTSTISEVEISLKTSTKTNGNLSPSPDQGSSGILLVAVLVALLVVIVLIVLLLLWRQRQKRRTGVLTLNRGGKRNGVVDAWAGPAQVPDEEAMVATVGGDKGSGVPEGEGSGRRPTLTTFFSKRKSHQGSLALQELECGSGSSPKGEEEPLVDSEDGALEAPSSDGPAEGDALCLPECE